jgi:hypothetical protein
MNFKSAPIFEIVRLIDLQPPGQTGFCMLVAPSADPQLVADLREELAVQGVAGSLGVIDTKGASAVDLVEQLRMIQHAAVLLHGFDAWSEGQFASLDVNRSRLETGSFLVFLVDLKTAGRFLDSAPNVRSFLGSNIFIAASDPSLMGREEIEGRLEQLRRSYGLSDAEVIEQAASRNLPPEPHFVEWLVLLGRSELVR